MKRLMCVTAVVSFFIPLASTAAPVGLKMYCCKRDVYGFCLKVCSERPIDTGPDCTPCLYGCTSDGQCYAPPG